MGKFTKKKILIEPLDSYLCSFINYERYKYFPKKVNLDDYKIFLKKVGNPHKKLSPSLLIAGTNGKGSVAALLSSILSSCGYRVGLFTSPHLFSYRERIKINGKPIPRLSFSECINSLKVVLEEPYQKMRRTFFEVLTTVAFEHFKRKKTNVNILEIGLGGRKDSTNVVNPIISVITSIGFDHTRSLGSTLSSIAIEKCGIIRNHGTVVTSKQHSNSIKVIERIARKRKASLYKTTEMIGYETERIDRDGIRFIYRGNEYFVPLPGRFQIQNLKTALLGVEILKKKGFDIPEKPLRKGLRCCSWKGRFDRVSENPLIILDGAHNPSAMREVMDALQELYPRKKIIAVFSCLSNKDRRGMARYVERASQKIILTEIDAARGVKLGELKSAFRRKVSVKKTIRSALRFAQEIADESSLIIVTGSIYLVAEAYVVLS